MSTMRCGRVDAHEPHDWSRPPGWSRPRRTYHCEGTPAAIEGGHFAEEREASATASCPGSGGFVYTYEGPQFGAHIIEEPCDACGEFHAPQRAEKTS